MEEKAEKSVDRRDFLKAAAVTLGAGLLASKTSLASARAKLLSGEPLDETEIHHLEFIREEEKLARDCYIVFAQRWGNPIFSLIIESEQSHMDAMLNLLEKYGIEDPAHDDTVGVYTDQYIQGLYNWLSEWGLQSEADALLVGAFIEEYDILDIWKAVADTDVDLIDKVYTNLYEGSYNHLHGYVYTWEKCTGDTYTPQLMDEIDFNYCMNFDTQAKQKQGR